MFGTLAVLLAMIGVYGVMSWLVGQRTREMGIRIALGAEPRGIARTMLLQSLVPVGAGLILGDMGGIELSQLLNSVFWTITRPEPGVLAGIAVLMLGAATAAAWVPMRRVLTLDPNRVLRDE